MKPHAKAAQKLRHPCLQATARSDAGISGTRTSLDPTAQHAQQLGSRRALPPSLQRASPSANGKAAEPAAKHVPGMSAAQSPAGAVALQAGGNSGGSHDPSGHTAGQAGARGMPLHHISTGHQNHVAQAQSSGSAPAVHYHPTQAPQMSDVSCRLFGSMPEIAAAPPAHLPSGAANAGEHAAAQQHRFWHPQIRQPAQYMSPAPLRHPLGSQHLQSVAQALGGAADAGHGALAPVVAAGDLAQPANVAARPRELPNSLRGASSSAAGPMDVGGQQANVGGASEDSRAAMQAVVDALEVSDASAAEPPPGALTKQLMPYQKLALGWMLAREGVGRAGGAPCPDGGILADDQVRLRAACICMLPHIARLHA